jgi:hypothetical protein
VSSLVPGQRPPDTGEEGASLLRSRTTPANKIYQYTEAARAQGSAEFQTYSAWPRAPSILTHSPAASHTPSHHTAAPLPLFDDRGYFQTAGPGQAMWAAPSPPSAFLNPGYDDPSLVQYRKMFMSAPGLSQVSPVRLSRPTRTGHISWFHSRFLSLMCRTTPRTTFTWAVHPCTLRVTMATNTKSFGVCICTLDMY